MPFPAGFKPDNARLPKFAVDFRISAVRTGIAIIGMVFETDDIRFNSRMIDTFPHKQNIASVKMGQRTITVNLTH